MVTFGLPDYYRAVKITNLKCLIIAGGAALFLGLAGNVHAIPFPLTHAPGSDTRLGNEMKGPGGYATTCPVELSRLQAEFAKSLHSVREGMDIVHSAGPFRNHNQPDVPSGLALTVVRQTCQEGDHAANVPDGGSTAIMMGAALIGLAFVQKKLKA